MTFTIHMSDIGTNRRSDACLSHLNTFHKHTTVHVQTHYSLLKLILIKSPPPIIDTFDGTIISFLTRRKTSMYYSHCEAPIFSLDLALVLNMCSKLIKQYLLI